MFPLLVALLKADSGQCQRLQKFVDEVKSAHAINAAASGVAAVGNPVKDVTEAHTDFSSKKLLSHPLRHI